MTFNPQPKPEPKKTWSKMTIQEKIAKSNKQKAKKLKEKIVANKDKVDANKAFFLETYQEYVEKDLWRCWNCDVTLPAYDGTKEGFKVIRGCIHHLVPKHNHEALCYLFDNTIPLCWHLMGAPNNNCHGQAESAISVKKMKIYPQMQQRIEALLGYEEAGNKIDKAIKDSPNNFTIQKETTTK